MDNELKLGKYRHFEGKSYEVIGVAKSADNLKDYVVYKALYEDEFPYGQIWIRQKAEFLSEVPAGRENPFNQKYRFEYIDK